MSNAPRPRILLIEDDSAVAGGIVRGLRRAGFEVELAADGLRGADLALNERFDLVVLDLMLPERDGFEVLRMVRARSTVPIVVVTAKTELPDRLQAFALGAVDYLPKPFFVEELLARIEARLALSARPSHRRVMSCGPARVDLDAHTLEVEGEPVRLTPTEFAILRSLIERAGRAVSRADLAQALRDSDDADPTHLEAHVSRLRRKLGVASKLLVTVWGHGYRFDLKPSGGEP